MVDGVPLYKKTVTEAHVSSQMVDVVPLYEKTVTEAHPFINGLPENVWIQSRKMGQTGTGLTRF